MHTSFIHCPCRTTRIVLSGSNASSQHRLTARLTTALRALREHCALCAYCLAYEHSIPYHYRRTFAHCDATPGRATCVLFFSNVYYTTRYALVGPPFVGCPSSTHARCIYGYDSMTTLLQLQFASRVLMLL